MKIKICLMAVVMGLVASVASADGFGSGENQFTMDFVTIDGSTNPTSGYGIVNNDYRMSVFEVTDDQWEKFKLELGVPVTGNLEGAYNNNSSWSGSKPTGQISWYEGAQFVNWLNTSSGYSPAYNFTGTQGTNDYTFAQWSPAEADNGTNLFRHKDAFYFMPTEDEWVKAAYWNGTSLQTYATPDDMLPIDDVEANYDVAGVSTAWDVGSGNEELNGTFDMMGNLWEWMEDPYEDQNYNTTSNRGIRGGVFCYDGDAIVSSYRYHPGLNETIEHENIGFRVASEVIPEPASIVLLSLGGLALLKRRR